jgi:hypothetical protein
MKWIRMKQVNFRICLQVFKSNMISKCEDYSTWSENQIVENINIVIKSCTPVL